MVVMGVAGCGKSSLAAELARALGRPLVEGDDFHSPKNVAKMAAGVALQDVDRVAWLDALGREMQVHPGGVVLTCSALKKIYRERLRAAAPGLRFVHLVLTREEARRRVALRGDRHYFVPTLVDSQFDTLESPADEPGVLSLDATRPLEASSTEVLRWIEASASGQSSA